MEMNQILVINAGSSSVKTTLFKMIDEKLKVISTDPFIISKESISKLKAIGFRVVHGGQKFTKSTLIDFKVLKKIEELSILAPLHNPMAVEEIKKFSQVKVPKVAVFDTAFFSNMPLVSTAYPLPEAIVKKYKIKKYGFHGIAHESMYLAWSHAFSKKQSKIITLQLGSGCSATALVNGNPIETSMGFTPLEGLIMGTRGGDIDPGLIEFLSQQEDINLSDLLNHQSGLKGLSGISGDVRVLMETNSPQAHLAIEVFCHRLVKYLGAYLAVLRCRHVSDLDALIFSGGIGENCPAIRFAVLDYLGISFNEDLNDYLAPLKPGELKAIGPNVYVFGSNENHYIAEQTLKLL